MTPKKYLIVLLSFLSMILCLFGIYALISGDILKAIAILFLVILFDFIANRIEAMSWS